ncbi:MAG: hypothetical protein ACFHVJ_07165 [Aestuariibacter sp.]
MEEILAIFLKGIVRGIAFFIGEIIGKYLCYFSGVFILKVVTLGQNPKYIEEEPMDSMSGILTSCLGGIVLSLAVIFGIGLFT